MAWLMMPIVPSVLGHWLLRRALKVAAAGVVFHCAGAGTNARVETAASPSAKPWLGYDLT